MHAGGGEDVKGELMKMRRVFVLGLLLVLVALGIALYFVSCRAVERPLVHKAVNAQKVWVCHFDSTSSHAIHVSLAAVRAHIQNHGDCIIAAPSDSLKAGDPCDCAAAP